MQNAINELSLQNYRNLKSFELTINSSPVLIIGDNGMGKTNILEAISMLAPGRGLRNAKLDEIYKNQSTSFRIEAKAITNLGIARISTSYSAESSKRLVEFNESKITNSELAKLLKIIWLTPQMEGLFLGLSSDRRKFLDRIVYCFHPEHASLINKYDYYLRERMKILQLPSLDYSWLKIIEEKLALEAASVIKNRRHTLELLQASLDALDSPFPKARLDITKAEEVDFEKSFADSRELDRATGRSNFGPHRSDLLVYYDTTPASQRSTGEQKAMLISITIAQVIATQNFSGAHPILLLDEIFVHLDETRRNYLAGFLSQCGSQVWITSTEDDATRYFGESQVTRL